MSSVESIRSAPSISPTARTCISSNADLHKIIGVVESVHAKGAAKWLQRVTGKSARTVAYWLSRDYEPRGADTLKIAAALRAELAEQQQRLQQFEISF